MGNKPLNKFIEEMQYVFIVPQNKHPGCRFYMTNICLNVQTFQIILALFQ